MDGGEAPGGGPQAAGVRPEMQRTGSLSLTASLDQKARELREQVNEELDRATDGSRALRGVVSLLCERLITVEQALALSQRSKTSTGVGTTAGSMTEAELTAMTTTEDGVQTQLAWSFPSAAPVEVVQLHNRVSRFEEETRRQLASIEQRLILLQAQTIVNANNVQMLAHNVGGTVDLELQESTRLREMVNNLRSDLDSGVMKRLEPPTARRGSGAEEPRTAARGDGKHAPSADDEPSSSREHARAKACLRAASLRALMPKTRRQLARRRWREACADVRAMLRFKRGGTRPALKRKLKEEETVVARLGILDQQVSEAMRRAEGALKEEELHPILKAILKRLLDDEGVSRQAVEANVQSLCQKLASALIQHQTQEARDVLRATNPSRGGEQQEEGEDDEEQSCFFQLHCLLRQLADSLSKAVEGAREQRLVVEEDQLTDLRNKLLDLEAQALMGQDSGGKQGIESAGRFVERAVLEATKDGSRVLPLLQALPFHPSPPAVAEKGQAAGSPPSAWTGISLAGALGLLLHHMALALQGAKLQQVELLALSNSQARSWAEQGELNKVNDTLLGMRSQMVTDLDQLYNAVNRLETALAETKAFQELLRAELQSTLAERHSLEEAVSKLSGRSEMLRSFLDGKIAEVERMVQQKAAANEVFTVKASINDVMTHLLKLREGLPPEGYWSDMAEQIKGKADKKILYALLKSREARALPADDGSHTPAVGRVKLRCLSCDKALPPDPQERPYMGSPRHDCQTAYPQHSPQHHGSSNNNHHEGGGQQYEYQERYTYERQTVDFVVRERPKSSSVYDRSSSRSSPHFPRTLGGPLGSAMAVWRLEGDQPATANEAKGLKRQLFHQRLRDLVVEEAVPAIDDLHDQPPQEGEEAVPLEELGEPTQQQQPAGPFATYRGTTRMKQASSQQQQQAHAVHYSKVDGKAVRPQSAPGQPRYGTLAFDHASATQQGRQGWGRRSFSKLHVPQRGFPLKLYQQGPF